MDFLGVFLILATFVQVALLIGLAAFSGTALGYFQTKAKKPEQPIDRPKPSESTHDDTVTDQPDIKSQPPN